MKVTVTSKTKVYLKNKAVIIVNAKESVNTQKGVFEVYDDLY